MKNSLNGFLNDLSKVDYSDCLPSESAKSAPQSVCTPEHLKQASGLLRQAMQLLWGDLLDSEGMQETPERVARHWASSTWGLHQSPIQPLQRTFSSEHDEVVLIRNIPFCSLCEHHLLPFFGVAHIAYLPQGKVVGLSKIPRCLDVLAARPQMQENITTQLAKIVHSTLNAAGTIVVLEAEHTCMATRGVLKAGAMTTTQAVLGLFKTNAVARADVLTLIRNSP